MNINPLGRHLIVVNQAWIWKTEDILIISGGREFANPRALSKSLSPKFVQVKRLLKGLGMILTNLVVSTERIVPSSGIANIFKIFEVAITAVAETVDRYLLDISIGGINIETEKNCLHRIIDIQEELSMIKRVILQQEIVWRDFASQSWPEYWPNGKDGSMVIPRDDWLKCSKQEAEEWEFIQLPESKFRKFYRLIAQLDEDAQRVERSVTAMLDLKSKHATIQEAHTSAIMGAAVVGFTIVTIIFAPLTFMTSLFALPITTLQNNQHVSRFTNESGSYRDIYFARWTGKCHFRTHL